MTRPPTRTLASQGLTLRAALALLALLVLDCSLRGCSAPSKRDAATDACGVHRGLFGQGPPSFPCSATSPAGIATTNTGPFTLADGETLNFVIGFGSTAITVNVMFLTAEFVDIAAATGSEVAAVINATLGAINGGSSVNARSPATSSQSVVRDGERIVHRNHRRHLEHAARVLRRADVRHGAAHRPEQLLGVFEVPADEIADEQYRPESRTT